MAPNSSPEGAGNSKSHTPRQGNVPTKSPSGNSSKIAPNLPQPRISIPRLGYFDPKETTHVRRRGAPIPEPWTYTEQETNSESDPDSEDEDFTTEEEDWEMMWHKVLRGEPTTCRERSNHKRRIKYSRKKQNPTPEFEEQQRIKREKATLRARNITKQKQKDAGIESSESGSDEEQDEESKKEKKRLKRNAKAVQRYETRNGPGVKERRDARNPKKQSLEKPGGEGLFIDCDTEKQCADILAEIPSSFLSSFSCQDFPTTSNEDQENILASSSAEIVARSSNLFLETSEFMNAEELKSKYSEAGRRGLDFVSKTQEIGLSTISELVFSQNQESFASEGKVGLLIISRCSGDWVVGGYQHMMLGNDVVAQRFETDFLNPLIVVRRESVSWHDTKAGKPLPTIHPGRGLSPLNPNDDTNKFCDARYIEFFENTPDFSTVFILFRGIDGGTIDKGSYLVLEALRPRLDTWLAISAEPSYMQNQPAFVEIPVNPAWFFRTNPFDEKVYIFFQLSRLNRVIRNEIRDAKYDWLLCIWKQMHLWREELSRACSARDPQRIAIAQANYADINGGGRNDWPILP